MLEDQQLPIEGLAFKDQPKSSMKDVFPLIGDLLPNRKVFLSVERRRRAHQAG